MENVQYRDLSLMVPNPKNPRKWKNDSEIKNLAESIRKNPDFFEARPILLSDRTGVLMIAAEQLNRNCFMCEIEPKYCDVIIDRWETLTGMKAKKIN